MLKLLNKTSQDIRPNTGTETGSRQRNTGSEQNMILCYTVFNIKRSNTELTSDGSVLFDLHTNRYLTLASL